MTRKDFVLIAATVRDCCDDAIEVIGTEHLHTIRHLMASYMADALATTNPNFDRARFLTACGVQS